MTAPLIVGLPAAAHREALLRPTAGGGRVPTAWGSGGYWWPVTPGAPARWAVVQDALILSHPTDPEAGAMGLARLEVVLGEKPHTWRAVAGWVVRLGSRVFCAKKAYADEPDTIIPALRDATCAAEAIGLVCVHLGLLERVERVERVEVPHGG